MPPSDQPPWGEHYLAIADWNDLPHWSPRVPQGRPTLYRGSPVRVSIQENFCLRGWSM
jgi:hypothetical protein